MAFSHTSVLRAAPGDLDTRFSPDFSNSVLQPDGKLLVGSSFHKFGTALMRLHPDGTVDSGFTLKLGDNYNYGIYSVLVQPDGKILAGGSFNWANGEYRIGLTRLLADGARDSSFQAVLTGSVRSLALQEDGKILAGGDLIAWDGHTIARSNLVRFNTDGTLDTGFDAGEILGSPQTAVTSIVVQPDGRILAGGMFSTVNGILRKSVARLHADGALDESFNADVTVGQAYSGVCLSLNPNGKILIGGDFQSEFGIAKRGLERVLPDGMPDPLFNPEVPDGQVTGIMESADGKILVSVRSPYRVQDPSQHLLRLNADGRRDASFAQNTVPPPYQVFSLSMQPDGKVLASGHTVSEPLKFESFFIRLENEPAISVLSAPAFNRVQWLRGGSSPEVLRVSFDFSTDEGLSWRPLGVGTGISGGWELTGPGLPDNGLLRARAPVPGGLNNGSYGLAETVTRFSGFAVPEVAVMGNGQEIVSGDQPPREADHRDFGQVDAWNGILERKFTILNRGSAPLSLKGAPAVGVEGRDASDFIIISQPSSTVAPGTAVSFTIRFDPRALGVRTASITIGSDDADERIYQFAIQGTGVGLVPEVAILGNGVDIAAGDDTPSLEDHTDFGKVGTVGGATVRTFTIANSGTGGLTLTGRSLISISGPQAADFTVTALPAGSVPPGGDTPFQITFLPSAPGLRQATVRISGDDEDERDFLFGVQGSGRFPGEVQAVFPSVLGSDFRTMAVQGDGKILIGLNTSPYLIRLEADGTSDPAFKAPLHSPYSKPLTGIAVQPDGKILVTGYFDSADNAPMPGIVRLLPDGALDGTFQSTVSGVAVCMVVQSDGKILLGGNLGVDGVARSLVRLDTRGAHDPKFNPVSGISGLTCLALMENGKIMMGGEFTTVAGMAKQGIARLNADGTPDPEFNAAPNGTKVICMAPKGDGKLIITGNFNHVNGTPCDGIARLLADGSVDREYHGNLGGAGPWVLSLALQVDGGLVLGGEFGEISGIPRLNVARLSGDGTLDADFNPVVNTFVDIVLVEGDGEILLGGGNRNWNGTRNPGVTRLENSNPGHGLTVSGYNRMRWMRSGTSPEASAVVFEASADNGLTWQMLGPGVRISGGWELNGPGLPAAGLLRASALTVSSAGRTSNGIAAETVAFNGLIRPGMTLTGNGMLIQNGDSTPILTDHTDFGPASVRGGLVGGRFTIHNTGPAPLNLLGWFPITVTGHSAAEFRVEAPSSRTAAAGESLTFEVFFDPAGLGTRTAMVHIASDDFHGADFTFAVRGTGSGLASEISVTGNESEISNGDITPSAADHTDFGSPRSAAGRITRTFMIVNNGTMELILAGITISGPQAAEFTVAAPPVARVPANGAAAFRITFDPIGIGSRKAVVEVASDDDDEGVFRFSIQGLGWSPGDLDPDFQAYPNLPVSSLGLQSDGRILIGGPFSYISQWAGTQPDRLRQVARKGLAWLMDNGALDTALNMNFSDGTNIYCTARQPDGKLLVGGSFSGGGFRANLVRMNADGTPDSAFLPRVNGYCRSLAVMPDGKIVICGEFTSVGGLPRAGMARLNSDGTLDTAFDLNTTGTMRCVLRQPDGKLLVAGAFSAVAGVARSQIARLNADDSLDPDFAPVITGDIRCMALQTDGIILVGGAISKVGGVNRSNIARLNPDGALDTVFNPGASGTVLSMAVQTDGRIVVAGDFMAIGPVPRSRLARLNSDGTLDRDFDTRANDTVRGVLIDSRGRLIIGGLFTSVDGAERSLVARLDNDPAPQELQAIGGSRVRWLRGGASAETYEVSFDLSTDGAVTWIRLGAANRIEDGWELTGLTLPSTGKIRARARIQGGYYNGSSSLLETVAEIGDRNIPQMTVEQPLGSVLKNGAGKVDFGIVLAAGQKSTKTLTMINRGNLPLRVEDITLEGAGKASFSLGAGQATAFSLPGWSSKVMEVHFNPTSGGTHEARLKISSNADEGSNPFLVDLAGRGNTPPHFSGYVLQAGENSPAEVTLAVLGTHIQDLEGDMTFMEGFSEISVMGGSVLWKDSTITYHPPHGYTGLDLLGFGVRDAHGAYAPAYIIVRVDGSGLPPRINTLELARFNGFAGLVLQGISGRTYQFQRSADLKSWTTIGTEVADEKGTVPFMDEIPLENKTFYRVVQP